VEYGYLLERTRDSIKHEAGSSVMAKMLLFGFGNARVAAIVSFFARIFRATRIPALIAKITPRSFGKVKFSMAMLAATSASNRLSNRKARGVPVAPTRGKIALLLGCVQEGLYTRINRATEYVLAVNGFEIVPVPGQACCGALHAHSGELEGARVVARQNIEAFERSGAEYIVVNAAGCGAQMKQYAELLEDDETYHERAKAIVAKVRDVNEFLAGIELKRGGSVPLRVTYDAPCHLYHAQRITTAPLDVMRTIPDLEIVPLPRMDECCGGAGIYGLLHQDLGGRILKDKVSAVASTNVDVVATPNPGCMMQIGAGLIIHERPESVVHPIELLAESYRRAESD
jgi:glycolate oxidase iron-sulfur subunit